MVTGSSVSYPFECAAIRPHGFFRTSGEINEFMKMHVINLAKRVLRQIVKRNYRVKVTIMGFVRESSTINIIQEHAKIRAKVPVYDPFVQSLSTKAGVFASAGSVEVALSGAECEVVSMDHDEFREISVETVKGLMASPVVLDEKNLSEAGEGIVRLGIGKGER